MKDDGIVSIVFAHTDVEAWEQPAASTPVAGLVVTTSWPMRSEMASRPTALISAVLSSSVGLVCRKQTSVGGRLLRRCRPELEAANRRASRGLRGDAAHGADYFVSAVGPAFEVFAGIGESSDSRGKKLGSMS